MSPRRHDSSSSHGDVHSFAPHDWRSDTYVKNWIRHDMERNDERRPRLKRMVALAPFSHDAAISVLDIGAGYGVVTEELLGVFPNARVTLQDYSDVMLDHARQRFAHVAGQIRYVLCDLTDASRLTPRQRGRAGSGVDIRGSRGGIV